jgi:hypothetical protein
MQNKEYHTEKEEKLNVVNEEQAFYDAAEKARIKQSILRTDEEKFHVLMRLMKIDRMLKNAKITHAKM